MATIRLFTLLGASIPRSSQIPAKLNRICLSSSQRINRYSSSTLVLNSDVSAITGDDSSVVSAHPWPEWVKFINQLKTEGYLTEKAAALESGGDGSSVDVHGGDAVYTEMKLVKEACLRFARYRFDILRSLSTQDVQRIVEKGCPNLLRKGVNSAKRLRAYLGLDEGDVCSSCNLRGSCDRAYILLNDSEADARTVDIVRILLYYALDPLVVSGENMPPGRELIESSARKLLLELVELGKTPPDPDLPKLPVTSENKKQYMDDGGSKNFEMKLGDWVCTKCNFMNFARNVCCLKCKEAAPKIGSVDGFKRKKGDWDCSQCSFMNFASNKRCFRCQGPRPMREMLPGDWECLKCDFVNYSRNTVCRKCNVNRPSNSERQYEEQTWKRPY